MNFEAVMEAYRNLLLANPGKALLITGGNIAFLDDKDVYGASLMLGGTPDLANAYELETTAYDDGEGCWDGMTPGEMLERITNPTFIDFDPSR